MTVTILILAVTLITIVFYFSRSIKKNPDLLTEANAKSVKIIDEANNKAMDIINKANLSTDTASGSFNRQITHIASLQVKEFEKTTSNFIKLHNQVLQELKSKNIEVLQNVSKDIEISSTQEIKDFRDSMKNLTVSSQNLVKEKIDADYKSAQKEIEDYYGKSIARMDEKIYEMLKKISKMVLGKALNLSEHEDLILQALEKAKKEETFE